MIIPCKNLLYLIVGLISGFIYSTGSYIKEYSNLLYFSLGILFFLKFFNFNYKTSFLFGLFCLIYLSSILWFSAIFFEISLSIIFWKIGIGCYWIFFLSFLYAKPKFSPRGIYYFFLVGFSISIILIFVNQLINHDFFRLSFLGDANAPHLLGSCLIILSSALLIYSKCSEANNKLFLLFLSFIVILISLFTLSKIAFLGSIILIVSLCLKKPVHALIFISFLLIILYNFDTYIEANMFRLYNFKLNDVSIAMRLELLISSIISSFSYYGLPGFIGYPKWWIDSSIGSLVSSLGLWGTLFYFFILFHKLPKINTGIIIFGIIFISTEHLILPRSLLPILLMLYAIKINESNNERY